MTIAQCEECQTRRQSHDRSDAHAETLRWLELSQEESGKFQQQQTKTNHHVIIKINKRNLSRNYCT
jgi:hypothetical protein